MLISHKYKFICLNPPKTGTGFRENLFLRLNKHLECTLGKNKYNQRHISLTRRPWAKFTHDFDPSDYYIFTFVRNPWERAASWFNMLRGVSSSTFISNAILNKIRISPQIDFCQNSNMKVDFVGDSACQNSELSNIFNKLDILSDNSFVTISVSCLIQQFLPDLPYDTYHALSPDTKACLIFGLANSIISFWTFVVIISFTCGRITSDCLFISAITSSKDFMSSEV